MKSIVKSTQVIALSLLVLLSANVCLARGTAPDKTGLLMSSIPLMLFLLLPIVMALIASKKADKFKALVFVTTFFEWLGWILCISIIGIPLGLALVLIAQSAHVLIEIEKNTSETKNLLKQNTNLAA